jgi:D-alanyl-D-alanine carboxypeptidase
MQKKTPLRMMVQHRSGVSNFANTVNFWSNPTQNHEDSLELIVALPANFALGKNDRVVIVKIVSISVAVSLLLGCAFITVKKQLTHGK